MGDTMNVVVDVPVHMEDLKYMHASNVNVSNFVSVSIEDDYYIWKRQMDCLMESQKMRGIVDDTFDGPSATGVSIKKQYDNLLRGWILGTLRKDVIKKVGDLKSAAEVWKKLKSIYDPEANFTRGLVTQEFAIGAEIETEDKDKEMRNKELYKASVEGHWWKAKAILKTCEEAATEPICNNGNTMLHLAVGMSQNYFVESLLSFIKKGKDIEKKNSDGQTALHIAAIVDNKYAAELLLQKRKELLGILDKKALAPLLTAYNNMNLATFIYLLEAGKKLTRSPDIHLNLDSYLENAGKLVITAIFKKQYELAMKLLDIYPNLAKTNDQILMATAITFPTDLSFGEAFIYPSLNNVRQEIGKRVSLMIRTSDVLYKTTEEILWKMKRCKNTYNRWLLKTSMISLVPLAILYPAYELIRLLSLLLIFPFCILYFVLWNVLAIIVRPIKNIEKRKKEYKEAKQILSLICHQIGMEDPSDNTNSCYRRPIIEAVRQGAYEVVAEILRKSPKAIDYKNEEEHNVIQLAIIYRSDRVYNLIRPLIKRKELYTSVRDSNMNNLMHLVGRLAHSYILSRTTGAALQLQRELQWRQEVQKLMSPAQLTERNVNKDTPEMVFRKEHEDLLKKAETWMKTTAESCSITAALIVTIVFAAAITVPGGNNQETGIPLFKKKVAFTIFAVCDAISLFSAATSLLLFLSILTARFAEKDFLTSIPRRLISGVFTLFLSTTALMVAFGAILFLVFCEHVPWMLIPIGILACVPIAVIVFLQSPLVVDLFRSTFFPIFC